MGELLLSQRKDETTPNKSWNPLLVTGGNHCQSKPVLFPLHYEPRSQKEIMILTTGKRNKTKQKQDCKRNRREQVKGSAHNSIYCVLVCVWKTRSISWVGWWFKRAQLEIYATVFYCLRISSAFYPQHLVLPGTIPVPPYVKSLFSLGEQFTGQMPGYRRCFSGSSICLLGRLLGQFHCIIKMARGSVRAQLPTGSQVAYQPLPGCLEKKIPVGLDTPQSWRSAKANSSLVRTILANAGFCWEPRNSHDPLR